MWRRIGKNPNIRPPAVPPQGTDILIAMKKNEYFTGISEGLGTDGEAMFSIDGHKVFVPYCLEGEEAEVKILSVKGDVAYGKCMKILKPSPDRVIPACPAFGRCGGCQLQHMSYDAQLRFKRAAVKNTLYKIAGIDEDVLPVIPSSSKLRYRNKLVLPVGRAGNENVFGFYAERSHRIVPVEDCPIQSSRCADIISAVKRFMSDCGYKGYDETCAKGDIRRVVVREAEKKFIVALVVTHEINAGRFADILKECLEGEITLLLNINTGTGNAIFGDKWRIVTGDGFFESEDMGIKFRAGANTFLQINDGVRTELYKQIIKEVADPEAVVLDLYSGGGMLTALLSRVCGMAYGIEIVKEASVCADELKNLNGLDGRMFNICGAVEKEMTRVLELTSSHKRIIVCDPPRKGMDRAAVKAVAGSDADKVILISCNPATLARDLGILTGALKEEGRDLKKNPGYKKYSTYTIEYIQPYDMFPQTKHVESMVVLRRN